MYIYVYPVYLESIVYVVIYITMSNVVLDHAPSETKWIIPTSVPLLHLGDPAALRALNVSSQWPRASGAAAPENMVI